jgi:hypothetical protein
MLQRNGSQLRTIGFATGGLSAWQNKQTIKEEELFNIVSVNNLVSYPQGYGMKSIMMPMKAGGISARIDNSIRATADGSMGINIDGVAYTSVFMSNADGLLVVSGSGTASSIITTDGNMIAVLYAVGDATVSINLNHLTSFVDAYGWANCELNLVANATGALTAVAICSGDTVDETTNLTAKDVWEYYQRSLTTGGSDSFTLDEIAQAVWVHSRGVTISTKSDVYNASII